MAQYTIKDEWWSGHLQAGEDLRTLSPEWVWEVANKYGFQPNRTGPTERYQHPELVKELTRAKVPAKSAVRAKILEHIQIAGGAYSDEQIECMASEYLDGYLARLWSLFCFVCGEHPVFHYDYCNDGKTIRPPAGVPFYGNAHIGFA